MDKISDISPIHLELVKILMQDPNFVHLLTEQIGKNIGLHLSVRYDLAKIVRFEVLKALEQRFLHEEYLTTAQVAKILNCHPKTLLKTADQLGLRKFHLNPRQCRFLRSEVEQLKEKL